MQGIILAGGKSSRMKHNKMLLFYMGKPLINYGIDCLRPFVSKIIVVTGHYHDEISAYLKSDSSVQVVYNKAYEHGMFTSVKKGIAEATESVILMPGDIPLIKQHTIKQLIQSQGVLRVPCYHHKRGHPIYIDKTLFKDLLEEPDTSHLKAFRNKYSLTHVDVNDPGVLIDIDTKEALNKLNERVNTCED